MQQAGSPPRPTVAITKAQAQAVPRGRPLLAAPWAEQNSTAGRLALVLALLPPPAQSPTSHPHWLTGYRKLSLVDWASSPSTQPCALQPGPAISILQHNGVREQLAPQAQRAAEITLASPRPPSAQNKGGGAGSGAHLTLPPFITAPEHHGFRPHGFLLPPSRQQGHSPSVHGGIKAQRG